MSGSGRSSYRLVREESRAAGRRYRITREVAAAVCLAAGVVMLVLAIFMLTAEEDKLDRPVTEQAHSTSRTIVVSAVLLAVGPGMIALAALLHARAAKNRRSLAGSPLLWQTPYIRDGDLPFPDPNAPNDSDQTPGGWHGD
ncbi:MAG: hypothetical protein KKF41_10395 [Actinobacteria bacterium]|nr:hypothetical protein [Actinomycetota bacterium]MBU1943070.1 hypothetical protein [Actinomycetota bacterium]MBU2687983.1 hypothetical protein [Actinomycetota bacterium]